MRESRKDVIEFSKKSRTFVNVLQPQLSQGADQEVAKEFSNIITSWFWLGWICSSRATKLWK